MAKNDEHQPVVENPDVAYEKRDVNPRTLLIVLMSILVAAVIIHFGVRSLFDYFAARDKQHGLQPSTMVSRDRVTRPPEPRLQADPAGDMREMRAAEADALNSYGWVDRQNGVVRIPIEQAMKLLVQRGLPASTPGEVVNQPAIEAPPGARQDANPKTPAVSNTARVKETPQP